MDCDVRMHDVVALLDDMRARHFESGKPLLLHRGQIGTVVMSYEGGVFEVEFAAPDGRTYAMLPVEAGKLMVLRDTPDYAAA
jgi:hypothetical protein